MPNRSRIKEIPIGIGWLVGWKTISKYLGVSIPTAWKYMNKFSLPIYRNYGMVKALPYEIDSWLIAFNRRRKKKIHKPTEYLKQYRIDKKK